jgi:hypothetical protein
MAPMVLNRCGVVRAHAGAICCSRCACCNCHCATAAQGRAGRTSLLFYGCGYDDFSGFWNWFSGSSTSSAGSTLLQLCCSIEHALDLLRSTCGSECCTTCGSRTVVQAAFVCVQWCHLFMLCL